MQGCHRPKLRFSAALDQPAGEGFPHGPLNRAELPPPDFARTGRAAPVLLPPLPALTQAETIVITWEDMEWAALRQVFCGNGAALQGWVKHAVNMPEDAEPGWAFWGEYCVVEVQDVPVLLWKSNTHADFPGPHRVAAMLQLLAQCVQPSLILSVGLAGGARIGDASGTVHATSAAVLHRPGKPQSQWPEFSNNWVAHHQILGHKDFSKLLLPPPTNMAELHTLCATFNEHYRTRYTLPELDPLKLCLGPQIPRIEDATGGSHAMLTTTRFLLGNITGAQRNFAAIETVDALVGEACLACNIAFGFVRAISDPVQNPELPSKIQGNWASIIQEVIGPHAAYNAALTVWALLD